MKHIISLLLHPTKALLNLFKNMLVFTNNLIEKEQIETIKKSLKSVGINFKLRYPWKIILGPEYIEIGDNFFSFPGLRLEAIDKYEEQHFNPQIIIGNNVAINHDCQISAINKIVIGDGVLMASRIYISDHSHGEVTSDAIKLPPAKRPIFSKGSVTIGNNVWIGTGVAILPGVSIGNNCIIGANSVVTNSFPDNSVIAGNPAKVIKTL